MLHFFRIVGEVMSVISFVDQGLQTKTVECSFHLAFVNLYHLR